MLFSLLPLILANFMQIMFAAYPTLAFSYEITITYQMFLERVYQIRSLLNFVIRKHESHPIARLNFEGSHVPLGNTVANT